MQPYNRNMYLLNNSLYRISIADGIDQCQQGQPGAPGVPGPPGQHGFPGEMGEKGNISSESTVASYCFVCCGLDMSRCCLSQRDPEKQYLILVTGAVHECARCLTGLW